MKVFEYLDRISLMHTLVVRRKTGTPDEFARQLGISRTSLYELLDEMKLRGAPIGYSKSCRTFFYEYPFEIDITCSLRSLSYNEEKKLSGGLKVSGSVLFFRTVVSEIC